MMKKEFKNISIILCLVLLTVFMTSCGNDGNSSLSEIENFPVVSKVEQNSEISYQYDEVSEKFDESYKKLKEFSGKNDDESEEEYISSQTVKIPDVVGEEEENAKEILMRYNLKVNVKNEYSDNYLSGYVIEQSPKAGQTAVENSAVSIVVSVGIEKVSVPNVINLDKSNAVSKLENEGFTVNVSESYNSSVAKGLVYAQSPDGNSPAKKNSTVLLTVSLGEKPSEKAVVPNVVGLNRANAVSKLETRNFKVEEIEEFSDIQAGNVISQTPTANTSHKKGTSVTIVVSKGVDKNKEALEALQNYADSMQKNGEINVPYIKNEGYTTSWKVNQYKISDFNNDGSPELVIQYYCGLYKKVTPQYTVDNDKQGVALKIVKYVDGEIREYCDYSNFNRYIRISGADIGNESEVTEELFIDDEGNLGVLTSRAAVGAYRGIYYTKFVIKDDMYVGQGGFGISEHDIKGYYGMGREPKNAPYWFWESADNSFDRAFLFHKIDNVFEIGNEYIGLSEAREQLNSVKRLNKVDDFKITVNSMPNSIVPSIARSVRNDFYMEKHDE